MPASLPRDLVDKLTDIRSKLRVGIRWRAKLLEAADQEGRQLVAECAISRDSRQLQFLGRRTIQQQGGATYTSFGISEAELVGESRIELVEVTDGHGLTGSGSRSECA